LQRTAVDGLLVPPEDSVALASALDRLMGDSELRQQFGSRSIDVADRFGTVSIMELWDDALARAANGSLSKFDISQAA
jgi:GalNAc-alpha-(1->4)-GalNAc-alpha-(1->3)-diNAcBac-PP-undecaprenol alpha-1,4-N-acetyl-D-galactosaminyltransferase